MKVIGGITLPFGGSQSTGGRLVGGSHCTSNSWNSAQHLPHPLHCRGGDENYDKLLLPFVDGYRSVREWPVEYEGQVLLLMAARSVMLINYVLRMGFEAGEFVATSVEQMSDLL